MLKKIDAGDISENWDGLELRWFIHHNFCPEISGLSDALAARRNKYDYYIIVNNL